MVDITLVLRKISELETCKGQISEFSGVALGDYTSDWKTQRIVERTMQIMIESCVDVANHIISGSGMRAPTSYSDTFKILFDGHILDSELFSAMERMEKFRNIVVHQYEEVNAEIVIGILRKHLGDFDRFRDAILTYLRR
ncbi:MAG: DUF86 domain-containing protein [Armatimonadetes bacterium]|nr:DUF86 domain-containing protein [Armatimonadota bacterium]